MVSKPVVLVTGGTGFLGSHIIHQLLEQGKYIVRATARTGKTSKLLANFPNAGSNLQVFEVPSLSADHTKPIEGVTALIHTANTSFLTGTTGPEMCNETYHGTLNIINTAVTAGVKKVIITGSQVSLYHDMQFSNAFGQTPLTEKTWGPVKVEDIKPDIEPPPFVYARSKLVTERTVWEVAHKHPGVDFTVILPPNVYGRLAQGFPLPNTIESTIGVVYSWITGGPPGPIAMGHFVDVRDAARAHLLALQAPATQDGVDKRLLICGKIFTYEDAFDLIRKERPSLASRLPGANFALPKQTNSPVDQSLTKKIIPGLEYLPWQKTILDTVDQLIVWEEAKGLSTGPIRSE